MDAKGWGAWKLRPFDQAPAGITAAAYKLTGVTINATIKVVKWAEENNVILV